MRSNVSQSTCKSSKQTQHVSGSLWRGGSEENEVVVVESEEVVVVVVSFLSKPSSLFSFDLLFVAFDTLSFCGDGGDDVVVVVVEVDVVALVVVAFCFASLAPSSSFFFGTGLFFAVAAASLTVLQSRRCPPFFQWFT